MANNELKNIIGDKLDQAVREDEIAMLGDLLQMPSQETVDMWAREADKRIAEKKKKRQRILAACAIFAMVCVSVVMIAKGFTPPEATANPETDTGIETTMESTTQYESWDKLPEDIKEQFIEFKEFPEGYELEYVEVEESIHIMRVMYSLSNENGERIHIREGLVKEKGLERDVVLNSEGTDIILDKSVYVKKHEDNINSTTYSYVYKNIMIDIVLPSNISQEIVVDIIKKSFSY